jgi:hypothetical protein
MKHHLNVIILALRAVIGALSIMIIYQFGATVAFFTNEGDTLVKEFFSDYFTSLVPSMPYRNNEWFGSTFCILYASLLIYAIIGIIRFYKCLLRIEKGKMFYSTQGDEIPRAGDAIIIFAKTK